MIPSFSVSYYVLWVLMLLQAVVALAVLQQLGKLQELAAQGGVWAKDKLPLGSIAPEFIEMPSDSEISVASLVGKGGIILFLSPTCSMCRDLLKGFRQRNGTEAARLIAVCRGDHQQCAELVTSQLRIPMVSAGADQAFALYGVSGSPTAVVVDGTLMIRRYAHPRNAADLQELFAVASVPEIVMASTAEHTFVESQ